MIRIKMEADQTTPAQSATMKESTEGLERVTTPAPVPVAASPTAKSKDPKKVAAGRAGAATRKAKQECLLEELRAAKQSLQTEAVAEAATPVADVVPKEQPMPATVDPGDPVKADWTPWILLIGAGLAALCVWRSPLVKLTERRQKQQHPEARSSGASQPSFHNTPVCSPIEDSRSLSYGIAVLRCLPPPRPQNTLRMIYTTPPLLVAWQLGMQSSARRSLTARCQDST